MKIAKSQNFFVGTYKSLIVIMSIVLIQGCFIFDQKEIEFFDKSKTQLVTLLNLTKNKETISFVYRRPLLNFFYKLLQNEKIIYRMNNNESDLQIEFDLSTSFQNEISEIRKIISNDNVKCDQGKKFITLDSALTYLNLTKEEMISIYEIMKETDVVYISRFQSDTNSLYFLVEDKFYIIYSNNISELPLERKEVPQRLDENWYYYDGVL